MSKHKILLIILLPVLYSCSLKQNHNIDLSGKWQFRMDSLDVGIKDKWFKKDFNDIIQLPGSMAENNKGNDISVSTKWTGDIVDKSWYIDVKYEKFRKPGNIKIPFWLQPNKHYLGVAWYQKEINIPANWERKYITLFLERCHWETQVWINNKKVGMNNNLATPHFYNLTEFVKPGNNKITIRVDNRIKDIDPGQNAHSITDHTQTNWNGIVGKLILSAHSPIYFEKVKIYPNIEKKKVKIKLVLKNILAQSKTSTLKIYARIKNYKLRELTKKIKVSNNQELEIEYPMNEKMLLWDEFNPNVYTMSIQLQSSEGIFEKEINFGMREFKVKGSHFTINKRLIFLRGTLECAIFPKTGYPPTGTKEWERIFRIIKAHGLNHVRFHSWCPPEAAFISADKVGVYLQVECSAWATIGDNKPIDKWLYKEAENILDNYGNHPSFCLMAYGNEPSGKNQVSYLNSFVKYWKEKDPRHVYTSGAGWPTVNEMEFHISQYPRIQRWAEGLKSVINSKPPQTMFDYRKILKKNFPEKPVISHEIGQWCVYPNFKEIKKYTGVLKPKNFEIFKETLTNNNLGYLSDKFLLASGKLQALCYKADIEAALRTPGLAGFQLLGLYDFPGQGTALVGVLDAFWEDKGYITPVDYRRFCNQTVPLARFRKRIFLSNEIVSANIEVAHFGKTLLKDITPVWKISNETGKNIINGKFQKINIPIGNNIQLGKIKVNANKLISPQKYTLTVEVADYSNRWDFWVYPSEVKPINNSNILLTSKIDSNVTALLNKGGSVLLSIKKRSLKAEYGGNIKIGFSSIFWNTAWTGKQAPHTLGILCNPTHPALTEFPTEYHSNWQWWDAMSHSSAIIIDQFPSELKPIVRVIDDWFENRSLALIFEAKAGKGKIIISGIDLINDVDKRPEARQLLYSLKKYMVSNKFNPSVELTLASIKSLLKEPTLLSDAKILYSDSEVPGFEANSILDNDPATFWHTPWEEEVPNYPHTVIVDLGKIIVFSGISLLPRQDGITGGMIKKVELYVSSDGVNWDKCIVNSKSERNKKVRNLLFNKKVTARFIKLVALEGFDNQNFASLAEIEIIQN